MLEDLIMFLKPGPMHLAPVPPVVTPGICAFCSAVLVPGVLSCTNGSPVVVERPEPHRSSKSGEAKAPSCLLFYVEG